MTNMPKLSKESIITAYNDLVKKQVGNLLVEASSLAKRGFQCITGEVAIGEFGQRSRQTGRYVTRVSCRSLEGERFGSLRWLMGERSIMLFQIGTSPQGEEEGVKPHYYEETDSLYIDLSHRVSVDSREVVPGVILDFDEEGHLVGIDIDNASKVLDLTRLETESVPTSGR